MPTIRRALVWTLAAMLAAAAAAEQVKAYDWHAEFRGWMFFNRREMAVVRLVTEKPAP